VRGGECDPLTASQMVVYALAQAFQISPLEVYKMPMEMVNTFMMIHGEVESFKSDEIEKKMKKAR
jgi:hypothetical protein